MELHVGLDIGSTTAKMVALNNKKEIIFKSYERHFSDIKTTTLKLLHQLAKRFPTATLKINASGSSGLGLCEPLGIPFIQEVVACTEAVKSTQPNVDVIVELGGEDAKLIYLTNGLEQRMNSACAGGTGAFIDQIANLLNTDAQGLNRLATGAEKIYPIASRCGVFAKTDIQPLLNEGVRKEDIAASVFQAVVNQTIGGLAAGRPIRGSVAFLGGPLTFLSELRHRFIDTLKLEEEKVLHSNDGHYYVAIGAALESGKNHTVNIKSIVDLLTSMNQTNNTTKNRNEPLFRNDKELKVFKKRHYKAKVTTKSLENYKGSAFLGIDAGSTTTKMVLIGEEDEVLYQFYDKNKGNPIETAREGLTKLYEILPDDVKIVRSTVTGYGEKLIQAAFQIDEGEIETVAHYQAAKKFQPDVDFILDIGGQDMKCIKIKGGVIDRIILNEACSAGCGSFLESFAETLGKDVREFSRLALTADNPVDLGSRCTVFMNSKVKQVQKEGASIADISSGLAYSVIMNALYKVIKLKSAEELGERIVVQGGTFLNEAVLRAFEKLIGKEVIRPDLAGLMGAYGCALLSKERWSKQGMTTLLSANKLNEFKVKTTHSRCGRCENNCPITVNRFADKRTFITGNRCERGAGKQKVKSTLPNLVQEKLDMLFKRESLTGDKAYRGSIGILRALNLFENYPFWHRFFTELGFEVVLSDPSSKKMFEQGIETISSESICFPAKLANGHMMNLIEKGVKKVFYPAVVYEKTESGNQQNHYNCPIVASYPEVIRVNMGRILAEHQMELISPFLSLENQASLLKGLTASFPEISKREIREALKKAKEEETSFKEWLAHRGEEVITQLKKEGKTGIIVAGHPYHIDPFINHGLPEEIIRLGMGVLTEDSVAHLANEHHTGVVNQWTFHSRLYRTADVVKKYPHLELLQVTSFGCGLDAITTDAVEEILEEENQLYTWIKMDEISNLGAARIRLRSLKAAMAERSKEGKQVHNLNKRLKEPEVTFDKEDKEIRTILAPQMLPTHFAMFEHAFELHGYKMKIIDKVRDKDLEEGLRYVNNDACYPAIITIGQLVAALKSGEYDLDRTAVIMSQTGGGCRATNYLALLKKALKNAGMSKVPVLSLNAGGLDGMKHPGFKITLPLAKKLVISACLGDLLMRLLLTVRPYERIKGSTELLYEKWLDRCKILIEDFSMKEYKKSISEIIADFKNIEVNQVGKPRVGIVGEILVKFHPYANNQLIDIIEEEGGEAVVPDFIDFFLYGLHNRYFKMEHFGLPKIKLGLGKVAINFIEYYRNPVRTALKRSGRFEEPLEIGQVAEKAENFLSLGNQMGEGWLLTGEMAELMDSGVENVVCVQPFGCLPNHVIGRGMFNAIKKEYPDANLISIDYDANISRVNQVNRIKLMINIAKNKIEQQTAVVELHQQQLNEAMSEK